MSRCSQLALGLHREILPRCICTVAAKHEKEICVCVQSGLLSSILEAIGEGSGGGGERGSGGGGVTRITRSQNQRIAIHSPPLSLFQLHTRARATTHT